MQIKDMIIISDLDGTVLPISGVISEKNLEAVERFRSLGGTFTVATGRSPVQARKYLDILKVKTPMIANNGANIYDPSANKNLWVKNFPDSYKQVLTHMLNRFPNVGVITISGDDRYEIVAENKLVETFRRNDRIKFYDTSKITDDCCKVLFLVEEEDMGDVSTYAVNQGFEDESFVISAKICLEMMPKGITKGYPFDRLLEFYGRKRENSVAVGDYNNDIEMLKKAGLGVAVGSALENVKAEAKLVVKSCEEDGIADLIDYIIANNKH